MSFPPDTLLFYDDLSSEQREALRNACAEDPALAEILAQWQQVRAALREQLDAGLPDRRLLVLHALVVSGRGDVLSPEEHAGLEAARLDLERALHVHPALADVVADVDAACADFDAVWIEHIERTSAPSRRVAPERRPMRRVRSRSAMRWAWRAVAVAAVVAFVAVLSMLYVRDQRMTTIQVAAGETRLVELADGSTVRLLGGATLTYADPDGAFNRRVTLTGRAFFDVTPSQRGFAVETPTALTTVLGTSFGIQADEATMEVVLATGRISVAAKAARDRVVVLEPGQRSRVARNALPTTPEPVELSEALAWTGLLLFRATPLDEVAAQLSTRYDVPVVIAPALQGERVTGTFDPEQPLSEVVSVLATTLDAKVQGNAEDGYQIVPAGG